MDETGTDVPKDGKAVGEVCVRSNVVFEGYWKQPDETRAAIVDGWFHTGDIVHVDEDGFVHIVDRAKDMVLRGGENVYCAEVEAAVYEHPDVAEAAVFGVPDERLGEAVGVAVFPAAGSTLTHEQLTEFLAERLAKYKIPEHFWLMDAPLPQNANGKFLKRQLRDSLAPTDD